MTFIVNQDGVVCGTGSRSPHRRGRSGDHHLQPGCVLDGHPVTQLRHRLESEDIVARNGHKNAEAQRLAHCAEVPWRLWGPYLSERQWGTVREDYSASGDAWNHFTHDQARSRAYRWGEDGLAGISDDRQLLCFALALWNGKDPILKERLFGLTNSEGNHGEDVKEYYFYLDSTPTHSYMKYLYKYPQAAYPYDDIVKTNQRRGRSEFEYELLDTGVFDEDRYFDVFVEYAKGAPRGCPGPDHRQQPRAGGGDAARAADAVVPQHLVVGRRRAAPGADAGRAPARWRRCIPRSASTRCSPAARPTWLFTENETNTERLVSMPNTTPYVKDGINNYVVHGHADAVNPDAARDQGGGALHDHRPRPAGPRSCGCACAGRRRVPPRHAGGTDACGPDFESIMTARRREADEFYASVIPASLDADARNVMRQALAGMLWSKQFYNYDVDRWLSERGADPFKPRRRAPRNDHWHHMENADIISMPDKWEYPWYAAWDLAFHVLALTLVDQEFGKQQLDLMLQERYLHPNGQIPAYEWNFGDVNPPVHAWSTIFTYRMEKARRGRGRHRVARALVPQAAAQFHLVGQPQGPRRARTSSKGASSASTTSACSTAVRRCRPAATSNRRTAPPGWRSSARTCSRSPRELALEKPAYADMCLKFLEHYLWIASSMVHAGEDVGMWDEEDGFFYDVLRLPGGGGQRLKVRSMVGLLPLCAVTVFEGEMLKKYPELVAPHAAVPRRAAGAHRLHPGSGAGRERAGGGSRRSSTKRSCGACSRRMLDEREFLSPYGIRSHLALPRGAPLRLPRRASRNTASRTCLPSPTPACSAATPTGAGRSGCRSTG